MATSDPYIRWGGSETLIVPGGGSAFGQQPITSSALVYVDQQLPETYSLFLFAALVRKLTPPDEVLVNWQVNAGNGNTSLALGGAIQGALTFAFDPSFEFLFNPSLAAPIEDYLRLATGYPQAFRVFELPVRKIQVQAIVSGVTAADVVVNVGALVAPRFNGNR
jgi:hypothetical protein